MPLSSTGLISVPASETAVASCSCWSTDSARVSPSATETVSGSAAAVVSQPLHSDVSLLASCADTTERDVRNTASASVPTLIGNEGVFMFHMIYLLIADCDNDYYSIFEITDVMIPCAVQERLENLANLPL